MTAYQQDELFDSGQQIRIATLFGSELLTCIDEAKKSISVLYSKKPLSGFNIPTNTDSNLCLSVSDEKEDYSTKMSDDTDINEILITLIKITDITQLIAILSKVNDAEKIIKIIDNSTHVINAITHTKAFEDLMEALQHTPEIGQLRDYSNDDKRRQVKDIYIAAYICKKKFELTGTPYYKDLFYRFVTSMAALTVYCASILAGAMVGSVLGNMASPVGSIAGAVAGGTLAGKLTDIASKKLGITEYSFLTAPHIRALRTADLENKINTKLLDHREQWGCKKV